MTTRTKSQPARRKIKLLPSLVDRYHSNSGESSLTKYAHDTKEGKALRELLEPVKTHATGDGTGLTVDIDLRQLMFNRLKTSSMITDLRTSGLAEI